MKNLKRLIRNILLETAVLPPPGSPGSPQIKDGPESAEDEEALGNGGS